MVIIQSSLVRIVNMDLLSIIFFCWLGVDVWTCKLCVKLGNSFQIYLFGFVLCYFFSCSWVAGLFRACQIWTWFSGAGVWLWVWVLRVARQGSHSCTAQARHGFSPQAVGKGIWLLPVCHQPHGSSWMWVECLKAMIIYTLCFAVYLLFVHIHTCFITHFILHVLTFSHIHIHSYIFTHKHSVSVSVCLSVCLSLFLYLSHTVIHLHAHTHTHTHTHTHICTHACTDTYTHIQVHVRALICLPTFITPVCFYDLGVESDFEDSLYAYIYAQTFQNYNLGVTK